MLLKGCCLLKVSTGNIISSWTNMKFVFGCVLHLCVLWLSSASAGFCLQFNGFMRSDSPVDTPYYASATTMHDIP